MSQRLLAPACLLFASLAGGGAFAQAPQAVPDDQKRSGETLTERLERTDGVIKPPPVDGPMVVEPPPEAGADMPVVKPPAPRQPAEPAR